MKNYKSIKLKPGKETAVLRYHPWIFSGAIGSMEGNPVEGDIVECFAADGRYLATGHFMAGSLAVKLFTFERQFIDEKFWLEKIRSCYDFRKMLNLFDHSATNAYRLVHNEGDLMPGLIVDIYNQTAVLQAHTAGMYAIRHVLAKAIEEVMEGRVTAVYDKSSEAMRKMNGMVVNDGFLTGEGGECKVLENGYRFGVNFVSGQKTGFFLDQRENRQLVAHYSAGRRVLNMFGYTGGFSVYAAAAGAALVHTVDSSAPAIAGAEANLSVNGFSGSGYECFASDARRYFDDMPYGNYDLMILDPPAYAKNVASRIQAVKGYRNINRLAFEKISPGGIIFTFSCSQAVDRQMFTSAVRAAAVDAGRQVRILHHLSQPPDHPVNIFHPEGEYLKGLVLKVE